MKYIKLFENFEEYYSLSDEATFESPAVGFSDSEMEAIDSMSNRSSKPIKIEKIRFDPFSMTPLVKLDEDPEEYDFFKHGYPKNSVVYQINILYIGKFISIRKLEDEWYVIRYNKNSVDLYYKCDQYDGLVKFLENL